MILRKAITLTLLMSLASVYATSETGNRADLTLRHKFDDQWWSFFNASTATRNDFQDFSFAYLGIGAGYAIDDNWAVSTEYRQFRSKRPTRWRDEFRPIVNLRYKTAYEGWDFSTRARLAFRFFEDATDNDRLRYRHLFRVSAPWKLTLLDARPYIDEELFYEFTDDGFNQNRISAGFAFPIADIASARVAYQWQSTKSSDEWNHQHLLLTTLVIDI